MTLKDALQRIAELEARIRALESAPQTVVHNHYHQPAPVIYPQPWPLYPTYSPPTWPTITCGDLGGVSSSSEVSRLRIS